MLAILSFSSCITKTKLDLLSKVLNSKKLWIILIHTCVLRIISIHALTVIAVIDKLKIHQMDIKTTFLNGDLDEEIHME